jgi:predicted O-linked N-acetylglucosamine transferase (SPINDLY family)
VAASLLQAVGLPELITHSAEDYRQLAVTLAKDRHRLAYLKLFLSNQSISNSLFDTRRFACTLESAFTHIYQRHHAGDLPTDFTVTGEAE